MQQIKTGWVNGTGAAKNVEVGFIPDVVLLYNWTDGDLITVGLMGEVIAFTDGGLATAIDGSNEVKAGDTITGLTNTGVTAKIKQVILDTGTWAAGDAAGWLILDADESVGTFGSENAEVNGSGGNDITVAAQVEKGIAVAAAAAAATGNAAISSYVGDADNALSKGFTIGSTPSEDAKLLYYVAIRNG